MGFFDKIKKALMGKEEPEQPPVVPEEALDEQTTDEQTNTQQSETEQSEPEQPETKPAEAAPTPAEASSEETAEVKKAETESEVETTTVASQDVSTHQLTDTIAEKAVPTAEATEELENATPLEVEAQDTQVQTVDQEQAVATETVSQENLTVADQAEDRPQVAETDVQEQAASTVNSEAELTPTFDATAEAEAVIQEAEMAPPVAPIEPQSQATVEEKYDKGLKKSRKTFGQRLNELFANFRSVDEDFFEEVEETLIGADVGFDAAMRIADEMRQEVKLQNVKKPKDVQNVIIEKLVNLYDEAGEGENHDLNIQPEELTVMLFVGVNGVGKTTSIGKLAYEYRMAGKKVLMAAADTFRAGAIDQLVVWGERAGVEVVRHNAGADPAAVVYDAVEKAKNEHYDILLVDTAGRLQNKVNLMKELDKIKRVIQRELPEAPHEVLLVVDATTGQNAMVQAKQFKETTDVSGIVLTKLDGTAKGGIVLAIRNELHLPVKLVGLGEGIDDLEPFDPNQFVIGLFKGLIQD